VPDGNETPLWSRLLRPFRWLGLLFRPQPPLIDRGFGLIYDTGRDITWLQDANYPKTLGRSRDGQLTWPEAMAWVAGLSYRGIRGWRLPTALNHDGSGPCTGHDCIDGEIGHLILDVNQNHPGLVTFTNGTVPCIYWTSTEASTEEAYAFDLFSVRQGSLWKDPFVDHGPSPPLSGPVLAWPVHSGDVAAELRSRWLRTFISAVAKLFGRTSSS
jgi:hypothetical protein